jgi:hypothetical protein
MFAAILIRIVTVAITALGSYFVSRGQTELGATIAASAPLIAGELKPLVRKVK